MVLKKISPDEARKPVPPRTVQPLTDVVSVPFEMPLRTEDLKHLLPSDLLSVSKPWYVSIPPGKQGLAMFALSKKAFTVKETDDRFVIHPKID